MQLRGSCFDLKRVTKATQKGNLIYCLTWQGSFVCWFHPSTRMTIASSEWNPMPLNWCDYYIIIWFVIVLRNHKGVGSLLFFFLEIAAVLYYLYVSTVRKGNWLLSLSFCCCVVFVNNNKTTGGDWWQGAPGRWSLVPICGLRNRNCLLEWCTHTLTKTAATIIITRREEALLLYSKRWSTARCCCCCCVLLSIEFSVKNIHPTTTPSSLSLSLCRWAAAAAVVV